MIPEFTLIYPGKLPKVTASKKVLSPFYTFQLQIVLLHYWKFYQKLTSPSTPNSRIRADRFLSGDWSDP